MTGRAARLSAARVTFAYPGDLATPTGGYLYDRRIIAACRDTGWTIDQLALPAGYPHPSAAERADAAAAIAAVPDRRVVVVDGLAFGAMAEIAAAEAARLQLVALVHHPLSDESGLDPDRRRSLFDSERAALAATRRVIVTSPTTAARLAAFEVPLAAIRVVVPGTDRPQPPVPADRRDRPDGAPVRLIAVASLTRRKGLDVLFAALGRLTALAWTLEVYGATGADPGYERELEMPLAALGDRVRLHGAVARPRLEQALRAADLFVSAALYEGYGMALAEALAYGLPIVAAAGGAVGETVPADAGLLVPPGDGDGLAAALARAIADPELRRRLAAGARAAGDRLPDWAAAGARFRAALADLVGADAAGSGDRLP